MLKGGYIARKETGSLELILLATGSELQHALKAADVLGPNTRVVSMACFERFERQSDEYKQGILPDSCRRRVSIEASMPKTWAAYVGLDGFSVGIDRFGVSGPGESVMKDLGITAEHVVEAARSLSRSNPAA